MLSPLQLHFHALFTQNEMFIKKTGRAWSSELPDLQVAERSLRSTRIGTICTYTYSTRLVRIIGGNSDILFIDIEVEGTSTCNGSHQIRLIATTTNGWRGRHGYR